MAPRPLCRAGSGREGPPVFFAVLLLGALGESLQCSVTESGARKARKISSKPNYERMGETKGSKVRFRK
jgi:hypothetical protein